MLIASMLLTTALAADEPAWPAPVPGFVAPAANEHPRLFFRKSDVAELRRRAATPEGQRIVARLRATLGGGDAMPTHKNPITVPDLKSGKSASLPEGAYSIGHAAGFGMLYQLTGEQRYADLGRQCFEWAWEGVRDIDPPARYGLAMSAGQLRSGPTLGWYAVGYDLCHDGWDPAFREKVATYIATYHVPDATEDAVKGIAPKGRAPSTSLEEMVTKPRHNPASNHWGSIVGGTGLALLAVRGDAGTDTAKVDAWLQAVEGNARAAVTKGFGDHGFFSEGQGAGHTGTYPALISYFQAMRVAAGKDYTVGRPNVSWLTLRWIMELTTDSEGRAWYPIRGGGAYGSQHLFAMNGALSHGGWFSQGFGVIPEVYKPALLWTYQQVCASDDAGRYDSKNYPQRAMLALVNWPIDVQPANPSTVMPRFVADELHGYYMFRDRWQDVGDSIVTVFQQTGPKPYGDFTDPGVRITKYGRKVTMNQPKMSGTPTARVDDAGNGVLQWGTTAAVAVDHTGTAGVPLVVAVLGGGLSKEPARSGTDLEQQVKMGGVNLVVCTMATDAQHPRLRLEGERAVLGGLSFRVDAGALVIDRGQAGLGSDPLDGWKAKGIQPEAPLTEADMVLPEASFAGFTMDSDTIYEKDGVTWMREIRGSGQDSALYGAAFEAGLSGDALTFPAPDKTTGWKGGRTEPGPAFDPAGASYSMSWWVRLKEPLQGYGLFFEKSNFKGEHADLFHTGWHPGPVLNFDKCEMLFPNEVGPWYHIAVTTQKEKKLFTYFLDGVARATQTLKKISNGQTSFYFGRGGGPDSVKMGMSSAVIDEVHIWKRALTKGEVAALHREGRARLAAAATGTQLP
jgi:hypothetical protein